MNILEPALGIGVGATVLSLGSSGWDSCSVTGSATSFIFGVTSEVLELLVPSKSS